MTLESPLKTELVDTLKVNFSQAVIFRLEDQYRAGIPDIVFNWDKITIWIEAKRANPTFKYKGIQEATCKFLSRQSHCWYVIYDEFLNCIFIVHPDNINTWQKDYTLKIEGYRHTKVADFIREQIHEIKLKARV